MNNQDPYNEAELLSQLKGGDESAFTQLYRLYSKNLYYNILSLVKDENIAEELLQDIFVTVWRKKDLMGEVENLSSYLFSISRNRVFDFLRKLKRDNDLYEKIKSATVEGYSHIEEALFKKENAELLQDAIQTMPPQRKHVFQLIKSEGLSYKQASELLGISISTVKDHMAKARQHIRQFFLSSDKGIFLCLCVLILFRNTRN